MIHADICGKLHVSEDVMTSCAIGLLQLLPDDIIIGFISESINKSRKKLDLGDQWAVINIEYWPYIAGVGIPDVLVHLESFSKEQCVILIEVKHGASQHGDQLATYWKGISSIYNCRKELIYLTHHRNMPLDEIINSEISAGASSFYWLSWYKMYNYFFTIKTNNISVRRIIDNILKYLEFKSYSQFVTWNDNVFEDIDLQYNYDRKYFIEHKCNNSYLKYSKIYNFELIIDCNYLYKICYGGANAGNRYFNYF